MLLLGVGAFLVWYVGPTATAIAFDGDRREAPYFLLQLIPQTGGVAPDAIAERRAGLVTAAGADGGRQIWSAGETRRHESRTRQGSYRGAMAAIDLLAFDSGAELVQMLTGTEFRALASGPEPGVLLAGTGTPPQALRSAEVTVVILVQVVDATVTQPFGEPGKSGWLAGLDDYQGRLAWDAPLDWLRGRQAWNRIALLQFPDAARAAAWLRDPTTLFERAVASRYLGDLLVLVALPDAVPG
jgi:hypothetical protein